MSTKNIAIIACVLSMVLAAFAGIAITDAKAPLAAKTLTMGGPMNIGTRGITVTYNQTFTVDAAWDDTKLFGAVFIQDQTYVTKKDQSGSYNWKSAEVLQAAMVQLDGTQFSTGTERYVLFELATGEWCGYCPAADGAFHRIVNDNTYFPAKCVPITWHNSDTYSNSDADSRNTAYSVPGYPTAFFDGYIAKVGGGTTSSSTVCDAPYKSNIDTRKALSSPFKITVKGDISGTSGWLNATCEKVATTNMTNVNIFFVVVEDLDTTYLHGSDNVPLRHTGRKILLKQPLDISNSPPVVTLTSNFNGQSIQGIKAVTWTATDGEDLSSALTVKIEYKQGAGTWTEIATTTNSGTYNWDTSTLLDGTGYNIRVGATDSGAVTTWATGAGTFTIDNPDPPTVALTYPTADLVLLGNVTATWTASDPEDTVSALKASLYYSTDSMSWHAIAENITNTGSHIWDTNTVEDGTNYKMKVVIWDTSGLSALSINSNTFTIDNLDNPLMTITTELDGKTFAGELVVKWTATDQEDTINEMKYSLYLSSDAGATWTPVFEEAAYPTQYKLDTKKYPNGQYLLKVKVKDTTGLLAQDVTNAPFTIYNNDPPTLTLTAPATGKSYDGLVNITYSASDKQDNLKDLNVSIYYSADASTWTEIIKDAKASTFYVWDVTGIPNGDYFVKVVITDKVATSTEVISETFTIANNLPPVISTFSPKGTETIKGEFAITWKATDPNKDELRITIQSQSCAGGVCGFYEDLAKDLANTGTYTVKAGVLPAGDYNFKIIAKETRADPKEVFVYTSDYVHIVGPDNGTDDDAADDDVTGDDDDTSGDDDTNGTGDDDTGGNHRPSDKSADNTALIFVILIILVVVIGVTIVMLLVVMKGRGKKKSPPPQQAPPQPQAAMPAQTPPDQGPVQAQPYRARSQQVAPPSQYRQMQAPAPSNALAPTGGAQAGQLALPPAHAQQPKA